MRLKCGVHAEWETDSRPVFVCHHCGRPVCEEHGWVVLADDAFSEAEEPMPRSAMHCPGCVTSFHPRSASKRRGWVIRRPPAVGQPAAPAAPPPAQGPMAPPAQGPYPVPPGYPQQPAPYPQPQAPYPAQPYPQQLQPLPYPQQQPPPQPQPYPQQQPPPSQNGAQQP